LTRPARFSGLARQEFVTALRDMEHATAAAKLRQAVDDAARRIGRHPGIGRYEPALADARYRFWSIPGFPYLLVYRPDTTPPSIVRFVHTSRDLPPLLADLSGSLESPNG
jgi:plasmid stabilization system protein ParE